ncbi:hypothetical protein LEP1GSC021_1236 [Leptospira noguchii str. 1993005606]|nr:hypothetical protein LEP1GSC021_1236 [Leptospira noguchii str. 1993005606]
MAINQTVSINHFHKTEIDGDSFFKNYIIIFRSKVSLF